MKKLKYYTCKVGAILMIIMSFCAIYINAYQALGVALMMGLGFFLKMYEYVEIK